MKTCTCVEYGYRADGEWGIGIVERPYRHSFDFYGHTAYVHRDRFGTWTASVNGVPVYGSSASRNQQQAERLAMVCASIRGGDEVRRAIEAAADTLAAAKEMGVIVKIEHNPPHNISR